MKTPEKVKSPSAHNAYMFNVKKHKRFTYILYIFSNGHIKGLNGMKLYGYAILWTVMRHKNSRTDFTKLNPFTWRFDKFCFIMYHYIVLCYSVALIEFLSVFFTNNRLALLSLSGCHRLHFFSRFYSLSFPFYCSISFVSSLVISFSCMCECNDSAHTAFFYYVPFCIRESFIDCQHTIFSHNGQARSVHTSCNQENCSFHVYITCCDNTFDLFFSSINSPFWFSFSLVQWIKGMSTQFDSHILFIFIYILAKMNCLLSCRHDHKKRRTCNRIRFFCCC